MTEEQGSVLVACSTYAGKQYCLDEWIKAYRALTYDPKFAYMVDNTRNSTKYFELISRKGIDATHLDPWPDWDRTFRKCWELMLEQAQRLGCYWVYSVEADNIPSPDSLETMVNLALYGKVHLVTHAYPMHKTAADVSGLDMDSFYYHELGCMLMSRRLLERAIEDFDDYGQIVGAIFGTMERYNGGYIKLTNAFSVEHLDGFEMSYENLSMSEVQGLICPTPVMPADFGTRLPPVLEEA